MKIKVKIRESMSIYDVIRAHIGLLVVMRRAAFMIAYF